MNNRMLQPLFSDDILHWPFGNMPLTKGAQSTGLSIWEEEDEIVIEAALPGIKGDHINIAVEKGVLTIQGTRREEKEDKAKKYFQKSDSSFHYSVRVPGDIDENQDPQATLKDGVLQIRFRKHKKSTPRKIQIHHQQ